MFPKEQKDPKEQKEGVSLPTCRAFNNMKFPLRETNKYCLKPK